MAQNANKYKQNICSHFCEAYYSICFEVKFREEDGLDYGGVSLQFYTLLAKELLKPESKVLQVNEHSALAWFPVDVTLHPVLTQVKHRVRLASKTDH